MALGVWVIAHDCGHEVSKNSIRFIEQIGAVMAIIIMQNSEYFHGKVLLL